jgi:hypothetical protein
MSIALLAALAFQAAEVRWFTDYEEAVTEARRSERPLLIFSARGACGNCRAMEGVVHAAAPVRTLLASFVCVKVDADHEPKASVKYLSQVKGNTLPFYAFTDPDGKYLGGTSGFRNEGAFQKDLQTVLQNAPPKAPPRDTPAPKPPPPPEFPPIPDDELDAAFIKAQMNVAREHLRSGNKPKAAAILKDIIKSNPRSPQLPEVRKLLDEAEKK